jgi:tetratricopeptide (TPR) repeat protein
MLSGLAFLLFLQPAQFAPGQAEYDQAVQLLQQGEAPKALQLIAKAIQEHPQTAALFRLQGVAHAQTGDLLNAADSFQTACRLNPNLPDACYYLGRALYSLNRFTGAIDALRKAVRVDGVKGRAETALAEAYEAMGQPNEAEQYFRWAIARKDRAHERALLAYARFLVRDGRTEQSLEPIQQALVTYSRSPEAHFQLARVLLQLDRLAEAVPPAEKAVALDPANPQFKLLLARIYRRLGRDADAASLERQ